MLVVNACIVGGVVYAGVKTLIRHKPQKKPWLATPTSQAPGDPSAAALTGRMIPDETRTSYRLTTASVSVGLSLSGALFSLTPLSLASVPLTVYNGLPIFERAWADLLREGRLKMALVQSIAVIGILSTQHYVTAALVIWLRCFLTLVALRARHFHELVWRGLKHDSREFLTHLYGARPGFVWVQARGVDVEIPFEKLRVGDIVVVNEGEVVPLEGTVVEGTAEVSVLLATGEARLVAKRIGDRIISSTMVVAGKMRIRVERL